MNIVIPALLLVVVSRIPAFVPAVLTAQCSPLSRIEAWMALALDLSIRKGDGNLGIRVRTYLTFRMAVCRANPLAGSLSNEPGQSDGIISV